MEDLFYHVVIRGYNRNNIFENPEDKIHCLNLAVKHFKEYVRCHAFVIMDNHAHWLLSTQEKNKLGKFMQELQSNFTRYYRSTYLNPDPVFQGRYYATLLSDPKAVKNVFFYIHLNPANTKKPSQYDQYLWSSISWYIADGGENQKNMSFDCEQLWESLRQHIQIGAICKLFNTNADYCKSTFRNHFKQQLLLKQPDADMAFETSPRQAEQIKAMRIIEQYFKKAGSPTQFSSFNRTNIDIFFAKIHKFVRDQIILQIYEEVNLGWRGIASLVRCSPSTVRYVVNKRKQPQ
ncbi:MAG: transposase [Peptococcaceae bacterium]|jgi:REP element-mobilizing transposase RayT|nr:transposase [Peptococcaceae bacterium]